MVLGFNSDEVLVMAIRIEENGAEFYRKAAGLQSDGETKKFLENLATMEDGHKKIFIQMRETLADKYKNGKVFDPQGELSLYLASMADTMGGEGSPSAADALTGRDALEDILETALGLEKDSILFYLGLKDIVPPKYGQDKIEEIIGEERKHVALLTGILRSVKTR
jgi:rubrerythrin